MRTVLIVWAALLVAAVAEADYVIGSGDLLEVSFWQDPQLNASVRVGQDGMIAIDIVGEIQAAGKTPLQLQDDIVRQMSRLNNRISQAVVRVTEYNYQHVFVTGQVTKPGKYTFETIPDLLTIIHEAGWITPQGDLTRVTIVRGGDQAGKVEIVDLSAAIAAGAVDGLPVIRRLDAIDIPMAAAGIPGAELAAQAQRKNVIYVTGAVHTPGAIRFEDGVDVYDAIALAGGPTDNANLESVRVITKDGYYAQALEVDLERYSKTGAPSRYLLGREDHVVVPVRRGSFLGGTVGTVATALGVATSAVLLYEALKPGDNKK